MNHVDWGLLKTFLAVIELKSLSKAAQELKISQPTVGRHIEQLEKDLGNLLFDRTARGYIATEFGLELAQEVKQMNSHAMAISSLADMRSNVVSGPVRISASNTIALKILPQLMGKLREKYPQIQLIISPSDKVENLLERKADIALRMVRPTQNDLITKRILNLEIGFYVSKKYPRYKELMASVNAKDFDAVLGFDLIGQDNFTDIKDGLNKSGFDINDEDFALRTDSYVLIYELIEEGLGCGFCLDIAAREKENMVRLFKDEFIASFPIWITAHRELKSNKRMRLIYDELSELLKNFK
ncbi:hypothetical protein OA92_08610 [Marinomonas sp. SBI22]|uniref:LysR family transcriptional regulator n=1 Tax=unclassified Marinomonas TaxID=196814 RepID=UPI0007AFE1BA|nr:MULTISPECIES: LysR family transcriptional regulator [unclassified Marinomonas]KZM43729.1 hypothetical protein OA92_08610 [Marinomonas sp. SBI22]KZM47291.1 hypothetical protein OA91_01990 [Marinomonas sp. SBI8L]